MITFDEMKRVTALAKIAADEDEINALAADFGALLELADIAANTDISAMDLTEEDDVAPLREDIVMPSLPRERVFQNTAEERDGYFVAVE